MRRGRRRGTGSLCWFASSSAACTPTRAMQWSSTDIDETILKTILVAVNEIAYQLRFRNIVCLIILYLIDMENHKNREKVRRTLEELLQKDKAKTTLNRISELGLIEMTRKRTRESLGRLLHEPCFYCDGTGQLQSKETIAFEVLRE